MKRILCTEQGDLFPSSEIFRVCARREPPVVIPPLPFARNKEIDIHRAARILGTDIRTVQRMLKDKLMSGGYRPTPASPYRIEHASIVEYCDALRVRFHIPARRRAAGSRPLDEDILPFPVAETIQLREVAAHLDVSNNTASKLLDTGDLVGYQLIPGAKGSTWRIHRPSFIAYQERLRQQAGKTSSSATS